VTGVGVAQVLACSFVALYHAKDIASSIIAVKLSQARGFPAIHLPAAKDVVGTYDSAASRA